MKYLLFLVLFVFLASASIEIIDDTLIVDIEHHECEHDKLASTIDIQFLEDKHGYRNGVGDWQPLKIHARFLVDDPNQCRSSGQNVIIDNEGQFSCRSEHVLSNDVASYIENIMVKETVERLESILEVDRTFRTGNLVTSSSYMYVIKRWKL